MRSGQLMGSMALLAIATQGSAPQGPAAPASPAVQEAPWVTYRHKNADFTIDHPADWQEESGKGVISVHFAHPSAPVHLFVAAFTMSEGSLDEFAKMKFGVQPEIFEPVGSVRTLAGEGWSGLVQEAADIRPERTGEARRLMLCAGHGQLYVSLTLYADPKDLDAKRQYYERIFTSLRFVPPGTAPPPAPEQHKH